MLAPCKALGTSWARGEREGYGGPRDVISLSLNTYRRTASSTIRGAAGRRPHAVDARD